MSTLRIYDTKGNAYSPDGTATGTNEQIKDLFYGGVRLAIRSDHRQELSLFFRARETRNARTEQFYAVYSLDNSSTPLRDLIDDLTTRIESEWGYTIDDSSEEMKVYRELKRGNTALPGDRQEQDILSELVASRSSVTVGVSDERNAIGLLSEHLGEFDQAAIADSTDADILSTFDLVVTPGSYRGITPLGETEARWESTAGSLQDKHIKQEIASIRESVETLSREYGLSNDEIRSRVQGSVPALKAPVSGSNLGSTSAQSDDDTLIPPEVGLYVAVGAVVLLVLFAAVQYGPMLLGLGSTDTGNQNGTSGQIATVSGELINSTSGQQIDESTGNVTVTLSNENGSLDTANQTPFNLTVNKTQVPNVTLVATADGYERNQTTVSTQTNISADRLEVDLRLDPSPDTDSTPNLSRVTGTVTDSISGDAVSGATVELIHIGGDVVGSTNATDGTYSFENVSHAEYTVSVSASGYVDSENNSISVDGSETQVDPISLDQTASLSVYFIANDTNTGLNGGEVRLIDTQTETETVVRNESKGGDFWYNTSDLRPSTYRLELFNRPGYEDIEVPITLEPGDPYLNEGVRVEFTGN